MQKEVEAKKTSEKQEKKEKRRKEKGRETEEKEVCERERASGEMGEGCSLVEKTPAEGVGMAGWAQQKSRFAAGVADRWLKSVNVQHCRSEDTLKPQTKIASPDNL